MVALAPQGEGVAHIVPFAEVIDLFPSEAIIEILCTQERAFGDSGLEPADEAS